MSHLKKAIIFLIFFLAATLGTSSVTAQPCGEFCSQDSPPCNPGLNCSSTYPPDNPYGTCFSQYAGGCPSCTGSLSGGIGACEQSYNCPDPDWREGGDSLV